MANLIGMPRAAWKRQPIGTVTVNQQFCSQNQCSFVLPPHHSLGWANSASPVYNSSPDGIYQAISATQYIEKVQSGSGADYTLIFYGIYTQYAQSTGLIGTLVAGGNYASMLYRASSVFNFFYKNGSSVDFYPQIPSVGDLFFFAASYDSTKVNLVSFPKNRRIYTKSSGGLSGASSYNRIRISGLFQQNALSFLYAAHIERSLNADELRELAENPWELFKPRIARFISIPSGGGVVSLIIQKATHSHSVDAPSLTQAHVLALADSLHGHSVESPILSQAYALTLAAAAHTQTVDSVSLTQASTVSPQDATHGQSAETPTLGISGTLTMQDALHGQSVETVALTQAHLLAIQEALHAQTAESLTIGAGVSLTLADSTHGQTSETPTVSVAFVLEIQDALQDQAADALALATYITLIVSDALHTQLAGSATEITLPTGERIFVVAVEDRLFLVAAEDRVFAASSIDRSFGV